MSANITEKKSQKPATRKAARKGGTASLSAIKEEKPAPGKKPRKSAAPKTKAAKRAPSKTAAAARGAKRPRAAGLSQLGEAVETPPSPLEADLESVANPHPAKTYLVRFTAPEFTSLCPVTGQPDFAHLVIDYAPAKKIVESKSLKLFLTSFRNHGGFHEDCTIMIAEKIIAAIRPRWLRIGGYWYPRGGIPIDVFYQTGTPPKDLWLPDTGVPAYRGRG